MEHQSQNRVEPIPKDAGEFFTPQPDPPVERRLAARAIDTVRAAGWYNYDNRGEDEEVVWRSVN